MRVPRDLDRRFFNGLHDMSCTVNGVELDVAVEAYYQPREYDTNTYESVTVECVWFEDEGNVVDKMTETEVRELEDELLSRFHSYCEEWAEGPG